MFFYFFIFFARLLSILRCYFVRMSVGFSRLGAFSNPDTLGGACDLTINFPSWVATRLIELDIEPKTPSKCGPRVCLGGSVEGRGALGITS